MKIKHKILIILLTFLLLGFTGNISFCFAFESVGLQSLYHSSTTSETSDDPTSSILYVGGENEGNFSSIRQAVLAAQKGDTIFVFDYSSPYYENLVIEKSLHLIGENKKTTIIDAQGFDSPITIAADNVTIKNFTLRNSGSTQTCAGLIVNSDGNLIENMIITNNAHGLRFEYSRDSTLLSNNIENCEESGIFISESSNLRIYENNIRNSFFGIDVNKGAIFNDIYANSIQQMRRGISLTSSSQNLIYWNIISDSIYGIYLENAISNEIFNENLISNNEYGIYILDSFDNDIYDENLIIDNNVGIQLEKSFDNDINENIIEHNDYGLFLTESDQNDMYWNQIIENHKGIFIEKSQKNEIYLNNILGNYQNGLVLELSKNTKVFYNNFIENYISAFFNLELFSINVWKNNYWDDWSGDGFYQIDGEIIDLNVESWTNFDFRPMYVPYDL